MNSFGLFFCIFCISLFGLINLSKSSTIPTNYDVVPGIVVRQFKSMLRANVDEDKCTEVGVKCSADCTTLITCMASNGTGTTALCSTLNPSTPVCDKNKNQCTVSLSTAGCEPPKDNYKCMMDGVFPDPRDCKRYYMCSDGGVTVVACNGTATFNAGASACISTRSESRTAAVASCPAPLVCGIDNPSYAVYKTFPAYYMLCIGIESYMMKCEDDVHQFFDIASKKCVYSCKSAGSFADTNPEFFWYCPRRSSYGIKNACPSGYVFNETISKCEPKTE